MLGSPDRNRSNIGDLPLVRHSHLRQRFIEDGSEGWGDSVGCPTQHVTRDSIRPRGSVQLMLDRHGVLSVGKSSTGGFELLV